MLFLRACPETEDKMNRLWTVLNLSSVRCEACSLYLSLSVWESCEKNILDLRTITG